MPDPHVGLLPRAMQITVEGIEILPSPGPQNADLCHPDSSQDVFTIILFHLGWNALVLTPFLSGRLSQSNFFPHRSGFPVTPSLSRQMYSQMGIAGIWACPEQSICTKYVEMATAVWTKRRCRNLRSSHAMDRLASGET